MKNKKKFYFMVVSAIILICLSFGLDKNYNIKIYDVGF